MLSGALLAGFVSGFAGFGTGMVASGFWFLALPAVAVPPLIILTSVVGQMMGVVRLRQSFNVSRALPFIVGGMIGLPIGIVALDGASGLTIRTTTGAFLILYAIIQALPGSKLTIGNAGGIGADTAIGTGGGFLAGFAGLPGPLPLVWLQLRGGPSNQQRMTYQPYNLVIVWFAGIGMAFAGQIDGFVLMVTAICVPVTALGTWIGLRLYSETGEPLFRKVVLALLLVSGMILVGESLSSVASSGEPLWN